MQVTTNMKLDQKTSADRHLGVALVTGGARGIGQAICGELATRGFDVAFIDLAETESVHKTTELIQSAGRRAAFFECDISLVSNHARVVNEVVKSLGRISCLVNNAGVQVAARDDLLNVDEAEFDRLIGINLRGTFFLTQSIAKSMLAESDIGYNRSIITITSANAHLVSPEKAVYCVSKAGLSMAMQNFAIRLAEAGVAVHEIRPGLIETDMTRSVHDSYNPGMESGALSAMRRWGKPSDIAEVVGTLAVGSFSYSTGDIYNVGGGMHIPRL